MPQKKNVKKSSSKAKKSAKFTSLALIEKDQQLFLKTPQKLALQLGKEINLLNRKQTQLNRLLNKNNAEIKKAEKNILAGEKNPSVAMQKKVKIVKKALNKVLKENEILSAEMEGMQKLKETASTEQKKLQALYTYLEGFEKKWNQESKPLKKEKNKKPSKGKKKESKVIKELEEKLPYSASFPQDEKPIPETVDE